MGGERGKERKHGGKKEGRGRKTGREGGRKKEKERRETGEERRKRPREGGGETAKRERQGGREEKKRDRTREREQACSPSPARSDGVNCSEEWRKKTAGEGEVLREIKTPSQRDPGRDQEAENKERKRREK